MIRYVIGFAVHIIEKSIASLIQGEPYYKIPYMTTHIAASSDHATINDNDAIRRLVPNLI